MGLNAGGGGKLRGLSQWVQGWTTRIIFPGACPPLFGLKYLNSLMRIRDPGWKKFGSGINIPDPQHCSIPYLTNGSSQPLHDGSMCRCTRAGGGEGGGRVRGAELVWRLDRWSTWTWTTRGCPTSSTRCSAVSSISISRALFTGQASFAHIIVQIYFFVKCRPVKRKLNIVVKDLILKYFYYTDQCWGSGMLIPDLSSQILNSGLKRVRIPDSGP